MNRYFITVLGAAILGLPLGMRGQEKGELKPRLESLEKRLDSDTTSGVLTKNDSDAVRRELDRIKRINDEGAAQRGLTKKTKRNVRQDLQKAKEDLLRKEKQDAALKSSGNATTNATGDVSAGPGGTH